MWTSCMRRSKLQRLSDRSVQIFPGAGHPELLPAISAPNDAPGARLSSPNDLDEFASTTNCDRQLHEWTLVKGRASRSQCKRRCRRPPDQHVH
jgi:hypothetical protein